MSKWLASIALSLAILSPAVVAQTTIVPSGSSWKYRADGSNQGTAWRATSFNDAAWPAGNAELGYGDGGEATIVSYGPSATKKYVTTYFRKTFTVSDPAAYSSLLLELMRDDGAVVYLNGAEVFRTNMPTGTISYTTLASTAVGGADESAYYPKALPPTALVAGNNVLAVEVHQNARNSSDLSFNLRLTGELVPLPAPNTPPVANNANFSTPQDDPVAISLTGSDLESRFGMFADYQQQGAVSSLPVIVDGLSGATYRVGAGGADPDRLFLIRNVSTGGGHSYEFTGSGAHVRTVVQSDFQDTEAIAWMDGTRFAIAEENNFQRISICSIPPGATTLNRLAPGNVTWTTPVGDSQNLGIEAICYDPDRDRLYYCTEKPLPATHPTMPGQWPIFSMDPATGVSAILCDLKASIITAGVATDLSDMAYDRPTGTLLLLSHESNKLIRTDLTGAVLETRPFTGFTQAEGLAISADRKQLWVMGEPKQFVRFQLPANTLTFALVSQPRNGTLRGAPPTLSYTPNPGFTGTDDFQFTVHDGVETSSPATVSITVLPSVSITAIDPLASEPFGLLAPGPAGYKGKATFRVTRSGTLTSSLIVPLELPAGTATSGADFTLAEQVTVPAGSASVDFSPGILNDDLAESDETIIVTIATSPNYTRASGPAVATIVEAPVVTAFEVTPLGVVSGNFTNPSTGEFEPAHHMIAKGIASPPEGQSPAIVGVGTFEGHPNFEQGFTSSISGSDGVYAIPTNVGGFLPDFVAGSNSVNAIAYAADATGNSHRMVGDYTSSSGVRPFYFQDLGGPFGNWQILPLPLGDQAVSGRANAVDPTGSVVGSFTLADGSEHYARWSTDGYPANPSLTDLGAEYFPTDNSVGKDLALLPGGTSYIVGNLRERAVVDAPSRGFLQTSSGMVKELRGPAGAIPAEANAVSAGGSIVGFFESGSNRLACAWEYDGTGNDPSVSAVNALPDLANSVANDVGPDGTVVGFSFSGTDPGERSARRAWVSSTAPDAVALDLTALLQGSGFVSINEVTGINDDQLICGYGTIDDNGVPRLRAFVLDIVVAD